MYFNNDDQSRDAEISQGLASAEYVQYASFTEHEQMLLDMQEDSRYYSKLAKEILCKDIYISLHFNILDAIADGRARESDLMSAFDDVDTVANTVAVLKKAEAAAIQKEVDRTGIDLSKMSETQLKHMKDYYFAILSSVS